MPDCPYCGSMDTKVSQTYYTKELEIIRKRKCQCCGEMFCSYQEKEITLNPGSFKLKYPSRNSAEWHDKVVYMDAA